MRECNELEVGVVGEDLRDADMSTIASGARVDAEIGEGRRTTRAL